VKARQRARERKNKRAREKERKSKSARVEGGFFFGSPYGVLRFVKAGNKRTPNEKKKITHPTHPWGGVWLFLPSVGSSGGSETATYADYICI